MLISALLVVAAMGQMSGETAFLSGDAAQRSGQWAAAVPQFEQAATDPLLKPYAELRIAESMQHTGDYTGAMARCKAVIEQAPQGPWTAIAQMRLAEAMASQGQLAESARLHDGFIKLPVEPWWLADLAKTNADILLRIPERQGEGLDYFKKTALYNIYPKERIAAAQRLSGSRRGEDMAAAALGYFRSASPAEAEKMLTQTAGLVMSAEASGINVDEFTRLMLDVGEGDPFADIAQAHSDSLWVRAWLVHAAREHAEAKRFGAAKKAAFAIADTWPKERDTGDTLNWLAKRVEDAQGFDAAVPLFYKMAEASPDHHHSDDGLLHVGDTYAARGNKEEALRAYNFLGSHLKDAKLQDMGYYKAALFEQRNGNAAGARAALENAASLAPGKFYAHRALDLLGKGVEGPKVDGVTTYLRAAPGMQATPPAPSPMVANAPQFKRLHFFGKYGLAEGEWEALDLLEKLQKDPAHEAIYQAIAETGFAHTALQFALAHGWGMTANGDKTLALRRLELPRAYWSEVTQLAKQTGVDPYLILAIAKQESTFRATVVSHAGASGVMQLMPKTAQWLQSKDPDIPAGASNNLKCPINSISLGANYIEQMIDRSGGNLIYAVASYNGGPGNVDKWRKQFPTDNLDAFIDSIPYEETKDYVRKVLGYYMGYRSLYPDAGV